MLTTHSCYSTLCEPIYLGGLVMVGMMKHTTPDIYNTRRYVSTCFYCNRHYIQPMPASTHTWQSHMYGSWDARRFGGQALPEPLPLVSPPSCSRLTAISTEPLNAIIGFILAAALILSGSFFAVGVSRIGISTVSTGYGAGHCASVCCARAS